MKSKKSIDPKKASANKDAVNNRLDAVGLNLSALPAPISNLAI